MNRIAYRIEDEEVSAYVYANDLSLYADPALGFEIKWLNNFDNSLLAGDTLNLKSDPAGSYVAIAFPKPPIIVTTNNPPLPTYDIDTLSPDSILFTASIGDQVKLGYGESVTLLFDFPEPVKNFYFTDISYDNTKGTVTDFKQSTSDPTQYTAIFTPNTGKVGYVTISLPSGSVSDLHDNTNTVNISKNINIDTLISAPSIAVTPDGNQYDVTFIFNESIQGFSANDIIASGGKFEDLEEMVGLPSGTPLGSIGYTAKFIPDTNYEGGASITIPAGAYHDLSHNYNNPIQSYILSPVQIDTKPPVVIDVDFGSTVLNSIDLTNEIIFTFNEPVNMASGKEPTAWINYIGAGYNQPLNLEPVVGTNNRVFTTTFAPLSDYQGGAEISAHFQDLQGNEGNYSSFNSLENNSDNTSPSLSLTVSDSELGYGDSSTITFKFSEPVKDFVLTDIGYDHTKGTVTGLTQSASDPTQYTAIFTPNTGKVGNVTISLPSGSVSDLHNNTNTVNISKVINIDTLISAPSISVTPVGNQYDVTFIFNESIQGFSANDIIASGGKVTAFIPSGTGSSQFTATFLPDIQLIPTNAQLIIPRGSYKDLSGNLNALESFNILLTPINSVVSKNSFNINSTHDLIDINYLDPLDAYSGVFLSSGNPTDFVYASNSSSVDNFKFKYVSGKFNLTGGDLNDYLDFGSFTTSGIRLIPYDYDSQSYLVDNNTGSAVTSLENVKTMGSIGGIEHVFGTINSDRIEFFAGDDFTHIVDAGDGNNYIKTADGDDRIFSGSGSDTVYSEGGNDRITLGDGDALVYAGVTLGDGDVLVPAGDGDNDISAGNGSNISIYAGIGNDHITLGDFASTSNIIHDLGGDNVITFGDGNFIVTLGDGNNSIHAGDGANTFDLSDGIVSLNTGNGVNHITIDSNDRVTINTGSGADDVTIEQASSDLLEYDGNDDDATLYRYKSSANLIGNQYKLDITYSIAALSIPHSILFVEVFNSNNKVLTRKEITVEKNVVSHEKLTLSYFGDVADGANSDEIQVKIHSYDNVYEAPIFTVNEIQLFHFYNGNTINVGDGNNTVNLQDGVYSVVAGKDNDEVTIGFGNSNINVGAGDDNIIHSQLFNGSQIFTIVASSSARVHIDEFDISPSVAILRRLSINSGDKFSITVPSSELNNKSIPSAILSKSASADDIYIVELMDAGNKDKVLATIELDWKADPLIGHGGYELDLLPASKKTLPNGDLEYTSGLRYKLMNESLVGDSSTNDSDTLILNSGVINGAVELNSLIAVGGLGGDVYSFRIQSDSILTKQLSNTIVDSGSIGVNQKDSIYIEGIRTFQDLDFHRIEMVNEGVKSLRIDYQQYTGWEQFTLIDEGVVNVFGQFNPSSPQYRIERLQFSPVTNEDGQIFVDALQEYSFGTSKYFNAKDKTIELDTIQYQKNSILIGQDDGSAIENFVINVTGGSSGTEKEVRIYGFDQNDVIKFKSPTKILDVTISDLINVDATTKWLDTTYSHRYSVDIQTGDTTRDHQLLTLILETGSAHGASEQEMKDVFKYL